MAATDPMTLTLDHIQIAIPKGAEAACRAFWRDGLGLTEIEKPEAIRHRGGLWLRIEGIEIHLGVDPDFHAATKAHPGFRVADIDAVAARLVAAGCDLTWDHKIKNRRRFFCNDPCGNRLEFLQED